jgi:hypothetical protein
MKTTPSPPCAQKDMFPGRTGSGTSLRLEIKGKIPSFKNNKMVVTKSPQGKSLTRPLLITKPEFQKRMQEIVAALEYQLSCAFRTVAEPTLAGNSIQYWIVLSVPADDCWERIPIIAIECELCEPGQEGATLTITRLSECNP